MAFNLGDIVVNIKAKTDDLKKGADDLKAVVDKAEQGTNKLGNLAAGVEKFAKAAVIGLTVATGAAVAFGVSSVKAYEETEKAQKQLEHAVIAVSHATKDQLDETMKLADALEKKGVLDGDNIKMGLAQLSTFGLSNKAVQGLGASLADLAVNQFGVHATGEQLSDTANMIAKALHGQFGILEKSGIRFTETQKSIIQFGSEMEKVKAINEGFAQNLKFTNEVALTTTEGKLAKAKVAFDNIKESIGKVVIEALVPLATKLADVFNKINWDVAINNTKKSLNEFWNDVLVPFTRAIGELYSKIADYLEPKFTALKHTLEESFPTFRQFIDQFINPLIEVIAGTAGKSLVWALGTVIDWWNFLLKIVTPVLQYLNDHTWIVYALATAFGAVATAMALGAAFDALRVMFVVFQTVQVPSMLATLSTLGAAFWAAFPFAAILAAATVAVAGIIKLANDARSAWDRTNKSIDAASDAQTKLVEKIQAQIKAGTISKEKGKEIIGNSFTRASGGPVASDTVYMTGEKGRELFMPTKDGVILPNDITEKIMRVGDLVKSFIANGASSFLTPSQLIPATGPPSHSVTSITNINGNINIASKADADYLLQRLDRNQQLESLGAAPRS